MKKKKTLIISGIVLIVVIAAIVTVIIVNSINKEEPNNGDVNINNNGDNSITLQDLRVSGKLAEYIVGLTNSYYIKYSGEFENSAGEFVNTIIEYTQDGKNTALKSNELNIHVITDETKLYSISHRYKMIAELKKESFDIGEYNLAADIGQNFVKSYKEKIKSTEYEVEEYTYNENTIKYYFKGNDIKLIRYKEQDINIIRVEKKTNKTLLKKPDSYSTV